MTLYMLEWYNGLEYADAETTLLGIYPSIEERELAEKNYITYGNEQWPFCYKEGKFVYYEIEAGKDLIPKWSKDNG